MGSKRAIDAVDAVDHKKAEKKARKEKKAKVEEVLEGKDAVEDLGEEVREKEKKKDKKERKEKKDKKDKKDKKEKLRGPNGEKLSKEERKALKAEMKKKIASGSITPAETGLPTPMDTDTVPTPDASSPKPEATSNGSTEPATVSQAEVDAFLAKHFVNITPPPGAAAKQPFISFNQVPLSSHPKLASSFSKFTSSFPAPSPIQASVWPYLFAGNDCVGVAETGSGKTLAFAVPALAHVLNKPGKVKAPAVCVVSPTRELAMQIFDVVKGLCAGTGLNATCIYGGVPKDTQREELKKSQIIVATPGRLNDLVEEGSANLAKVSYLVLDEADRMLDTGFEDAIRKIVSSCEQNGRQTLMFTATWPPSVRKLASTFMSNPAKITIGDLSDQETGELRANQRITQLVEILSPRDKDYRLQQILKDYPATTRILVFALYKKEAARVEETLKRRTHHKVVCIHGDMNQAARTNSINAFRSGKANLLVATDVAARGLDIPDVKLVINNTFPLTIEDYVHRIGRTGRAGETGTSITLFTEHEKDRAGALCNVLKKAGQDVPEDLAKWGGTVKKKAHAVYGAFFRETDGEEKKATKIKFDD